MRTVFTTPTVSARLCPGGVDTPYERAGRGPAVILLLELPLEDGRHRALVGRVASGSRVFLPDLVASVWGDSDTPPVDPDRWLTEFVEGLGLDRPIVVAHPAPLARLRSLATAAGDRFGGWVELPLYASEEEVDRVVLHVAALSDRIGDGRRRR